MEDTEMVNAFIHAQRYRYYERLINGAGRSFAELIKQGEMVEVGKNKDHNEAESSENFLQ